SITSSLPRLWAKRSRTGWPAQRTSPSSSRTMSGNQRLQQHEWNSKNSSLFATRSSFSARLKLCSKFFPSLSPGSSSSQWRARTWSGNWRGRDRQNGRFLGGRERSTKMGKIITFYSYKGGTGRSMALANVAFILASHEKKVLMIDWDLEAPGLHRYFQPLLIDPELTSTEGLIDFVWDFALDAVTPQP